METLRQIKTVRHFGYLNFFQVYLIEFRIMRGSRSLLMKSVFFQAWKKFKILPL